MTNTPLNGDASASHPIPTRNRELPLPANELKVQARLLVNAIRRHDPDALALARSVAKSSRWLEPETWTLTHCMNVVSARSGFAHWDHARRVLGWRVSARRRRRHALVRTRLRCADEPVVRPL